MTNTIKISLLVVAALNIVACDDEPSVTPSLDVGIDGEAGAVDAPVDMASFGDSASGRDGSVGTTDGKAPDAVAIVCDKVPPLKLVPFAKTSGSPLALVQAKGDERMFVAERQGLIRILRNGTFDAEPFLDMTASIAFIAQSQGERGLMNLALHPDFATNGRFYVFYTASRLDPYSETLEGDVVVAQGRQSAADPNKAEVALTPLLVVDHSEDHPRKYDDGHNGGFLAFGPDGHLYAGVGDGGNGWDDFKAGQNAAHSLAKLYRLDVDRPLADPHKASGAVWAMGTRNPFRGSFDRETGDLYFSDIGENHWEEINFAPANTPPGLNYGWGNPGMEGTHCFPFFVPNCDSFGVMPIFEYAHEGASKEAQSRAVVGGFVYRGKAIAGLQGRFLLGDYAQNQVFSLQNNNGQAQCVVNHTAELVSKQNPLQGLVGFGQDAAGELYLFDLFGNIYRLMGVNAESPDAGTD